MMLRRIAAMRIQGRIQGRIQSGMLALITAAGLGSAPVAHAQVAPPKQGQTLAKCDPRDWTHVEVARARVTRAVDGDTVRVMVGKLEYSVRMLSIDTPETKYLGKSQGYWGEQASARLRLEGQEQHQSRDAALGPGGELLHLPGGRLR